MKYYKSKIWKWQQKEKNQNHNGLAGSFTRLNYLFYVWVLVWSTPKGNGGGWMIVVLFMYRNKNCIFLPTFWNYSILQQGKNLVWQCISDIISWLYFAECPEHCQSGLFLFGAGRYSRFFLLSWSLWKSRRLDIFWCFGLAEKIGTE